MTRQMIYPLPKTTCEAYERHKGKSPQNPGLLFERFFPDCRDDSTIKKDGLEAVVGANNIDKNLFGDWQKRWEQLTAAAQARTFSLVTDWRLVAGLGRKGSAEVGFNFQQYGFPVLPGSSLKGLARAWAFYQLAEKLGVPPDLWQELEDVLDNEDLSPEKKQTEALQKLLNHQKLPVDSPLKRQGLATASDLLMKWQKVIGTTARSGQVIFFEAIPASQPKLELDIINPHYSDYYGDNQGQVPPGNCQQPKPVFFLTVAAGQPFRFALGWRGAGQADQKLLDTAETWLKQGLIELGVGAKTSAGYGYFRPAGGSQQPKEANLVTGQVQPTSPTKKAPLAWRQGKLIGKFDGSSGSTGQLRDIETGEEYLFKPRKIKLEGDAPGKNKPVWFALENGQVTALKRR